MQFEIANPSVQYFVWDEFQVPTLKFCGEKKYIKNCTELLPKNSTLWFMKSSGTLWFYAYIMLFLYCSWPMTLWYLPLPRPNGTTRASTLWRWKTPLAWKHQPSTSTSLVSWQISFFLFMDRSQCLIVPCKHLKQNKVHGARAESTHKGNTHAHDTPAESYRRRLTYLSTHTVYWYKIQFCHYFGGIWPYWKMDTGKHNFHEILLFYSFKLTRRLRNCWTSSWHLPSPNAHWLA